MVRERRTGLWFARTKIERCVRKSSGDLLRWRFRGTCRNSGEYVSCPRIVESQVRAMESTVNKRYSVFGEWVVGIALPGASEADALQYLQQRAKAFDLKMPESPVRLLVSQSNGAVAIALVGRELGDHSQSPAFEGTIVTRPGGFLLKGLFGANLPWDKFMRVLRMATCGLSLVGTLTIWSTSGAWDAALISSLKLLGALLVALSFSHLVSAIANIGQKVPRRYFFTFLRDGLA